MATIWVAESTTHGPVNQGRQIAMVGLDGTTQKITIGAASAQVANAFGQNVKSIILSTDAACHVAFGTNPTASTNNIRLPADILISVPSKAGDKIAVIQT